jgi:hypothetical protein
MIFQATAGPREKRLAHLLACIAKMQETEASKVQRKLVFMLNYIVIFFKI